MSSIYDPLGLVAPLVLVGKQNLQERCCKTADWDDPLPDELRRRWEAWRSKLCELERLRIQRCLKPEGFGAVEKIELQHFSDASQKG